MVKEIEEFKYHPEIYNAFRNMQEGVEALIIASKKFEAVNNILWGLLDKKQQDNIREEHPDLFK